MDMLAATRSRPDPAASREAWEQAQVGAAADDADWLAAPAMPKADKWPIDFVRSLGTRSIACKFVSPNPKRARGQCQTTVENYDRYMGATTVRDFFARGGIAKDLRNDVARGFCTLDEGALPAAWLEYAQSHGMPPAARYRAAQGAATAPAPAPASRPPRWTPEEEETLRGLVADLGDNWPVIAKRLASGRSAGAVEQKWMRLTQPPAFRGVIRKDDDDSEEEEEAEPAASVLTGQAALTALTAAIGPREPALTAVNGAQTQLRVDTMVAGRVSALKVCAVQLRATPGDVSGNVRRAAELIRASPGYHLYVLPELSSCGYGDGVLSNLSTFSQSHSRGNVFLVFQALAREVDAHICFGFVCRTMRPLSVVPAVGSCIVVQNGAPGVVTRANAVAAAADVRFEHGRERTCLLTELREPVFTIAQAVVAPTGRVELVYDKMHLCDMGKCSEVAHGLARGERPGVFTCRGWRVGVCICYDLRFPELWRRLAWEEDCDLIVHPSAFVRDSRLRRANQVSRRLQFWRRSASPRELGTAPTSCRASIGTQVPSPCITPS